MRSSLQSYRKVSLESEIAVASPHRIIQMMFDGALQRIAQSRYAIENNDLANKGIFIGKAIGIITGLNNSLNMEAPGEVSKNLSDLYDFMLRRISEANLNNDVQALDDVSSIIRTIKEGWDAIPPEQHHIDSHSSAM
ncbi:flagellar export chaperone FliS [Shewanella fidelis]|uniref:Flagellar secretion chaperone FliS n=1 Tax=Shewanella fidelis TaxID=173509 RepID=A0AAW8NQ39_9GAMM|nr:flagellar export chaperone FliS [Shewanella fidelis]MDR8524475.1 flagellar export chaperone FliS [Shewanella fidelis]MDW4811951.1 flagellar export chaperone FliS [Shewanella fidelis]MDW4817110.1 flagellar export chaperone FliS [Shewanella fidelis]MDW4821180.1 flagellar export chaperone FliS [Shewanella fidelis]MDW4822557.1 flagellar export chaperone FliS [Shewanella fidelis]